MFHEGWSPWLQYTLLVSMYFGSNWEQFLKYLYLGFECILFCFGVAALILNTFCLSLPLCSSFDLSFWSLLFELSHRAVTLISPSRPSFCALFLSSPFELSFWAYLLSSPFELSFWAHALSSHTDLSFKTFLLSSPSRLSFWALLLSSPFELFFWALHLSSTFWPTLWAQPFSPLFELLFLWLAPN